MTCLAFGLYHDTLGQLLVADGPWSSGNISVGRYQMEQLVQEESWPDKVQVEGSKSLARETGLEPDHCSSC